MLWPLVVGGNINLRRLVPDRISVTTQLGARFFEKFGWIHTLAHSRHDRKRIECVRRRDWRLAEQHAPGLAIKEVPVLSIGRADSKPPKLNGDVRVAHRNCPRLLRHAFTRPGERQRAEHSYRQ